MAACNFFASRHIEVHFWVFSCLADASLQNDITFISFDKINTLIYASLGRTLPQAPFSPSVETSCVNCCVCLGMT